MAINPHEVNPEPLTNKVAGGAIVAVAFEDIDGSSRPVLVVVDRISGGLLQCIKADVVSVAASTGPFYLVVDDVKAGERVVLHDRALIFGSTVGLSDDSLLYLGNSGDVSPTPNLRSPPVAKVIVGNSANGSVLYDVRGTLASPSSAQTLGYIPDPGTATAIPVTSSGIVDLVIGAGAETNTLAAPTFIGQRLVISAGTVGAGTRAITSSAAINAAGNTVMTFNAVRDTIELLAILVGLDLRWQVHTNQSVTLS